MGSKAVRETQTQVPSSARVRREFLEFFAARGHRIVSSAPVFPKDDPTLLFTNAGMNQFKDVFLGTGKRDYKRAVDTQKCIRVSGKHNDLEEVGVDTYHHTFFEMLGNWSFGDYFKEEAIAWAWELLTEVWKLPKERLWVTVFAGDERDGLPADVEAERIWIAAGIDPARVLRFGRKDNFWEMGDTGPCGPCTEIHIDRGGPGDDPADGANRKIGVNAGNERFMEIWNNVFMQFNRMDDGRLAELPAKHVDTGMGFERVLGVLQGKRSNYDTDLFTPIFARISELSGRKYEGGASREDVAFRVIADHVRAVTSAFADGALPSNEGRGYVLRRLIRRASRFGRQALDVHEPFMHAVVPAVVDVLGEAFPEMQQRREHVQVLVRAEEEAFGKTLDRGLVLFEALARKVESSGGKTLPGDQAFELYATDGFPQDLVELMARERGLALDAAGWSRAAEKHQATSRAEGKFKSALSANDLAAIGDAKTVSTYHAQDASTHRVDQAQVVYCTAPDADGVEKVTLVLDRSPFYPEGGGQIGDAGSIRAADGSFELQVENTVRSGELVLHQGRMARGRAALATRGARVIAEVDAARRDATRANHTATHLLHKVLKQVLGDHVQQMGSYVGPDRLRFDFSNPQGLTPEQLEDIERRVNALVARNDPLVTTVEELEAAKSRGVVALFGEKYAERVRVVDVGGISMELCGGTHVRAAGDIGPFVIVSERAIQAGVRRIEALTREAAVRWMQEQRRLLAGAARALKAPVEDVEERIAALQQQVKDAKKQAASTSSADLARVFEEAQAALVTRAGATFGVYANPALDQKAVNELVERLKGKHELLALAVLGRQADKVPWVIACSAALVARGVRANDLVPALRERLGGGGGGSPEKAQGQGTNADAVAQAVTELRAALEQRLA